MNLSIKKVLTFRAASLGDALLGKYFLENVHAAYPDAACYLLVSMRGEMVRDLLHAYPWITVLEVNRRNPYSILKALRVLWNTDLTLTQGVSSGNFSTFSKFFARVVTKGGGLIGYTDTFPLNRLLYDVLLKTDHEKAVFLHDQDALRAAQIPVVADKLRYEITPDDTVLARFSLAQDAYIVLHLFSGSINRGLSRESMDRITETVTAWAKGKYTVVLTGGKGDQEVLNILGETHGAVSTAGRTSVREMANLIRYAEIVVSVDTGAAHMASGLGKRTIVMRCYQTANWWQEVQYTNRVTVLTGEKGSTETEIRNQPYPHSLNSISMDALTCELERVI